MQNAHRAASRATCGVTNSTSLRYVAAVTPRCAFCSAKIIR